MPRKAPKPPSDPHLSNVVDTAFEVQEAEREVAEARARLKGAVANLADKRLVHRLACIDARRAKV